MVTALASTSDKPLFDICGQQTKRMLTAIQLVDMYDYGSLIISVPSGAVSAPRTTQADC
jgi:hypothetical protein